MDKWKVGDLYRYQYDTNYFAVGVVVEYDQYQDETAFILGREIKVFVHSDGEIDASTIELRQTHKVTEALTRLGGVEVPAKSVSETIGGELA